MLKRLTKANMSPIYLDNNNNNNVIESGDNSRNKIHEEYQYLNLIHDVLTDGTMETGRNGVTKSMPPKLLSDNKKHIVIRPLCYVQEKDIIEFSQFMEYPIIPCNLCGSQENLVRKQVSSLIKNISEKNPKIPSNILHSMQSVKVSQLMDDTLWDFKSLEKCTQNNTVDEANNIAWIMDDE